MIITNNENSIEVRRLARIAWQDRQQLSPQDRAATQGNFDELVRLAQPYAPSNEDVMRARLLAARISALRIITRVSHECDEIVANNEGHAHTAARLERTVTHGKVLEPVHAHAESMRLHALLAACPVEAARLPE